MTYADYPYIWAWHKITGSDHSYIEDLVNKARRGKAPWTATYQTETKMWSTIRDCRRGSTRALCEQWITDNVPQVRETLQCREFAAETVRGFVESNLEDPDTADGLYSQTLKLAYLRLTDLGYPSEYAQSIAEGLAQKWAQP